MSAPRRCPHSREPGTFVSSALWLRLVTVFSEKPLLSLGWRPTLCLCPLGPACLTSSGEKTRRSSDRRRRCRQKRETRHGMASYDHFCNCYPTTLGVPTLWYSRDPLNQNQATSSMSSTNKNYITWLFLKADFALLFVFVLYLRKINNVRHHSAGPGPALKVCTAVRRQAPPGLTNKAGVHTMGTPTEVNKYTQEVSGKFSMCMIKPLDECQVWDS